MTSLRSARTTALAVLIAITLSRLFVASRAPLTPDEAYYWVWSRALAPGYLDHPPMVALWIRAGTAIAGQGPFGVRLLGPLSALIGSLLLWGAARDLGQDRSAACKAVAMLNATLLFGVGAATMTPDTPLLFFWTVALWSMARLIATGRSVWWLAIGAATGLALCSKYTAILFVVGVVLWLWRTKQWHWLRHPFLWLGGLLGAGVFAPVVWWNARHGWASFAKQGGRGLVFHPAQLPGHVAELLGGQLALATPLIFVLCCAGTAMVTREALRSRAAGPSLLACLTIPAVIVFAEHALGDRVQPNWPAIVYPAAVIAAGAIADSSRTRGWVVAGVALGLVLTAAVDIQTVAAPFRVPARFDPGLRLAAGYDALARQVQAQAEQRQVAFVAVDDYGPASLLAMSAAGCRTLIGLEPRWAAFDLPSGAPIMAGHSGLLLRSERRRSAPSMQNWASLVPVAELTRRRGGQIAEIYRLYQGVGRDGGEPAVLLPCQP